MRAVRHGQLVARQVREFGPQPVMAPRPQPGMRVVPGVLRSQVQLDRQLKVVHTVAVAQHHVQFAQGVPTVTDCKVGRQQLDAGCLAQGKLPQPFVVKPQPPAAELCQPLAQRAIVGIQRP